LEYHYYGAIAYIGNKNFDRALEFLSLVISAPAKKSVSAIQIEAYKKFVLVSLIKNTKLVPLPKYTVNAVEKICKAQAGPYMELVRAFEDTNIKMYEDTVNKSMDLWRSVSIVFRKI
jgi:COP9 signalosome complex subunit 3